MKDDWRRWKIVSIWEVLNTNVGSGPNFLSGSLFNGSAWIQNFSGVGDGFAGMEGSFDISFPRGSLSNDRWGNGLFGASVSEHMGFSFDKAIQDLDNRRYRFLASNSLKMVGAGLAIGELMSLQLAAGTAIVLLGGLAIPALMLGGIATGYVLMGSDPKDFEFFSLVSDINQTAIFSGMTIGGMEQENALTYSGLASSLWSGFMESDFFMGAFGKETNTYEYWKKVMKTNDVPEYWDHSQDETYKPRSSWLP